jgi:hypothetical protein
MSAYEFPNGIHVAVVYTGHDPESHLLVRAREPQLAGKEVLR